MQITRQKLIDSNTAVITYRSFAGVGVGDTSNLLPIPLLGASQNQRNLGFVDGPELDGNVNVIKLLGISASCDSEQWNLRILTRNNVASINTIHEILFYEEIEYSFSDFTFNNFIAENTDTPYDTNFYAQIANTGAIATGLISLRLIYKPIYVHNFV